MTEVDWLQHSTDPQKMLELLRGMASERKLRLFAVACCKHMFRRVRVPLLYEREVEVAERYADGAASSLELQEARLYSNSIAEHACMNTTEIEAGIDMADSAALNAAWGATQPGTIMPDDDGKSEALLVAEQAIQCDLLRDIIGNPFHPVALHPALRHWNDGTVVKVGQGIYDERAFDRLPILADALEEAGCMDESILAHCRQSGEHVRGCWVVDLVLDKK